MTVVCVAGMHRTGTSLVARALRMCGIYLGRESDLIPPNDENPEGYWENVRFVELNDRVLARLGGSWSNPPSLEDRWAQRPDLADLRDDAQRLVDQLGEHDSWAWKDPRNSLTLPFWQQLIPGLKVILCVRDPLEVALSLQRRTASEPLFGRRTWLTYSPHLVGNRFLRSAVAAMKRLVRGTTWGSPAESVSLWARYYEAALAATDPDDRLVTHYESFHRDSSAEVARLMGFVGQRSRPDLVERAAATISGELYRARTPTSIETPDSVANLYASLCAAAGPVYANKTDGAEALAIGPS